MNQDTQPITEQDVPYTFRRRPQASAPFPFREIEFARLLILRGRIQDGFARDDREPARS